MNSAIENCVPCKGDSLPASEADIVSALERLPYWRRIEDGKAIEKEWSFKNFADAHDFINEVAKIAEEENHHPDIIYGWGYAKIRLTSHSINALHANDFIVAAKVDQLSA